MTRDSATGRAASVAADTPTVPFSIPVARTLVLGIGNVLLADDGAGVHAVRAFARQLGPSADVECVDGGTLGFTLVPTLEGADRLIVFDAAQLEAPPGAVRCLLGEAMDSYLGGRGRSVHEVGLLDILAIARLSGCLPRERALIAIQPATIDWGENPSGPVAFALQEAVAMGAQLVRAWPSEAPAARGSGAAAHA